MKGWFQGALGLGLVGGCFTLGAGCYLGTGSPVVSSPARPASREVHRDVEQILRRHRLSRIIGLRVENRDGQDVGRVADLVVDLRSGGIPYVLVASSGLLGLGIRETPVPASAIFMGTAKKGVLGLDLSEGRWEHAPALKHGLAGLSQPERQREIFQFYGKPLPRAATGEPELAASGAALTPTGRSHGGGFRPPPIQLASALIGREVVNRQGQFVGVMSDLLVEFGSQKSAFAILQGGRLLRREATFVVSLHSLNSAASALIANANHEAFERAPVFNEHAWQTASHFATVVYRYPEPRAELEPERSPSYVLFSVAQASPPASSSTVSVLEHRFGASEFPKSNKTQQRKENYGKN